MLNKQNWLKLRNKEKEIKMPFIFSECIYQCVLPLFHSLDSHLQFIISFDFKFDLNLNFQMFSDLLYFHHTITYSFSVSLLVTLLQISLISSTFYISFPFIHFSFLVMIFLLVGCGWNMFGQYEKYYEKQNKIKKKMEKVRITFSTSVIILNYIFFIFFIFHSSLTFQYVVLR